jgi:glycogen debranching enzyme
MGAVDMSVYFSLCQGIGRSERYHKIPQRTFAPFYVHLFEAGLGTISEIFDGDPPHTPRGSISQAWSVAENCEHILSTYIVSKMRSSKYSKNL